MPADSAAALLGLVSIIHLTTSVFIGGFRWLYEAAR